MNRKHSELKTKRFSKFQLLRGSFLVLIASLFWIEAPLAEEVCDQAPQTETVRKAYDYYKTNQKTIEHASFGGSEGGGKIVINDFSQNPPRMFVLDPSKLDSEGNPTCRFSAPVDFGKKSGREKIPGCGLQSQMTPPGFHITTAKGLGPRYTYPKAVGLVSCEGQGSRKRGLLIHTAPYSKDEGRPTTFGTLSLAEKHGRMIQEIGGGSLVLNHFGDSEGKARECPLYIGSKQKCSPEDSGLPRDPVRSNQLNSNQRNSNQPRQAPASNQNPTTY